MTTLTQQGCLTRGVKWYVSSIKHRENVRKFRRGVFCWFAGSARTQSTACNMSSYFHTSTKYDPFYKMLLLGQANISLFNELARVIKICHHQLSFKPAKVIWCFFVYYEFSSKSVTCKHFYASSENRKRAGAGLSRCRAHAAPFFSKMRGLTLCCRKRLWDGNSPKAPGL